MTRVPTRRQRGRGQSLVEFALVLPVLMLILLIAIDFGRVFLGWVDLNNAVRIAANFAAMNPNAWDPGNPKPAVQAEYQRLVAADAAGTNCSIPAPVPAPAFPNGHAIGQPALVSVTCSFDILTPIIGSILPDPLPVTASAAFPIRAGAIAGIPVQTAVPTQTPAPTATPSPTPSPGATPTPTPAPTPTPPINCTVPNFKNSDTSTAQARWATAGFQTSVIFNPQVPPNYEMKSQSLTKDGLALCATATITVGP